MSDASLVDINKATAAELDAVAGLEGHGFEIVRYRGSAAASLTFGSSTRCLG